MLKTLTEIDKKISRPIIQMDNVLVSIILYPFAALFHPRLIFIAYLSVYHFSNRDRYTTLVYLLGTGICLLTTTILKKILKRARPELIKNAKKPQSFRKKQKNNSMPSGDSIQSALFVTYLYFIFSQNQISWGHLLCLIFIHIGVCLGRVYYMCHWIADTAVATILGIGVGYGIWFLTENMQLKSQAQMLIGAQL